MLSWDYGFVGTKGPRGSAGTADGPCDDSEDEEAAEGSGQSPVLCMRDRKSQACYWYLLPNKGRAFPAYENLITTICKDLDFLGYDRVIFRSDGEAALVCVLEDLKSSWKGEVVPMATPKAESAS